MHTRKKRAKKKFPQAGPDSHHQTSTQAEAVLFKWEEEVRAKK